ncbi:MAG: acyl-CoA dehydrogenase family protein [Micropepsaceae bacterium]
MTDLIATARSFHDELKRRAPEIETARRLPADLAKKFMDAGFFRLCVPTEYGGFEADPLTFAAVAETLAEADGSAAWVAMICASTGTTASWIPPAGAREIFARPEATVCGVFARRGKAHDEGDHYRVEGRWQWGSGSDVSDWMTAGCVLYRDGKPVMGEGDAPVNGSIFAPTREIELQGNWDTSGLCGSGSQDFVMRNVRVPKSRAEIGKFKIYVERPLYFFPPFGMLACGIASVMMGLARASIRELTAIASVKIPEAHRRVLAQRTRTQEDLAEAEALLRSGRAFFNEMMQSAWSETREKGRTSIETRRDLRLAITHAARSSVRAVDLMYNLGGGTSVYKTSPLQRIFRDVHVASQHMQVATPTMETAGRHMLGLDGDYSQL